MQQQLRKVPCISPDISCNLIVLSLNYPRLQVLIHGNLHGLLLVVEKTISRLLYNRHEVTRIYQKTVLEYVVKEATDNLCFRLGEFSDVPILLIE